MSTLVALIIQMMYIHYRKRYALIKSNYIHTSWGYFHTFSFSFYLLILQVTQPDRNTPGDFRRHVRALNIVPSNKLPEVLIVLHWPHWHFRNKRHKELWDAALEIVCPFKETRVPHFRRQLCAARFAGREQGQFAAITRRQIISKNWHERLAVWWDMKSSHRRRHFLLFQHSCKFICSSLISSQLETLQSCRGGSATSHANTLN